MLGLRVAVLSLLLFCLQGSVQARSLHDSSAHHRHHDILFKRQSNIEEPRCPPKGVVSKLGDVKDDYNPPESTAEQIRKENLGAYAKYLKGEGGLAKLVGTGDAAAAPIDIAAVDLAAVVNNTTDGTIAARSFRNRSLEPRVPNQNVPTDGSDLVLYTGAVGGPIANRGISTNDLCGCTVYVVSSPFATMMMHVWERRSATFAFDGPDSTFGGADQAKNDADFINRGRELLLEMLRRFGTGNEYKAYLPLDTTTVAVIAPAANPAYVDWEFWRRREDLPPGMALMTEQMLRDAGVEVWEGFEPFAFPIPQMQNPVSTHPIIAGAANPERLIYPTAAKILLENIKDIMIPGRPGQAELLTYRRRYNNDPAHHTDDRQYVAVEPFVTAQGTVATILYYDDDKATVLPRL